MPRKPRNSKRVGGKEQREGWNPAAHDDWRWRQRMCMDNSIRCGGGRRIIRKKLSP